MKVDYDKDVPMKETKQVYKHHDFRIHKQLFFILIKRKLNQLDLTKKEKVNILTSIWLSTLSG